MQLRVAHEQEVGALKSELAASEACVARLRTELRDVHASTSQLQGRRDLAGGTSADAADAAGRFQQPLPAYSDIFPEDDGPLVTAPRGREEVCAAAPRQCQCLGSFAGNADAITSVAVSPVALRSGARLMAAAGQDGAIKLLALPGLQLVATFAGHAGSVTQVCFSATGLALASSGNDLFVRIWRVPGGEVARKLAVHTASVCSVAFSPDGRLFASSGSDRSIVLYKLPDYGVLRKLAGHTKSVRQLAFAGNGLVLASASSDNTCKLWGMPNGDLLRTLTGHSDSIYSVAVSADASLVATGSDDGSINVYRRAANPAGDDARGPEAAPQTLVGHTSFVRGLALSADGALLVSASHDGTCRCWSLGAGRHVGTMQGHGDFVRTVALSADATRAYTGSGDRAVSAWRISDC